MHRFWAHPLSFRLFGFALSTVCIGAALSSEGPEADCPIGAYRFSDGEIVDIARSEGGTLRWRKFDGTTGALRNKQDSLWTSTLGWTDRPDGHTVSFTRCATGELEFDGKKAHRIPFDVTDTVFDGRGGIKLAGRLVLPQGKHPFPIVVFLHVSQNESPHKPHPS